MAAVKFRNFYNVLHVVGTGEKNHLSTLHFNSVVFTKYLRVSGKMKNLPSLKEISSNQLFVKKHTQLLSRIFCQKSEFP